PGRDREGQARMDRFGDPLPPGAVARLGTVRFRSGGVTGIVYSPDGKLLDSAGDGRVIHLWDVDTGKEVRRCVGLTGVPWNIALSPNGKTLATADETIRFWDPTTGKEIRQMKCNGVVHSIAFSPNSKILASGGADKVVRLWDVATGQECATLQGH